MMLLLGEQTSPTHLQQLFGEHVTEVPKSGSDLRLFPQPNEFSQRVNAIVDTLRADGPYKPEVEIFVGGAVAATQEADPFLQVRRRWLGSGRAGPLVCRARRKPRAQ
jgi:hypothetical protein